MSLHKISSFVTDKLVTTISGIAHILYPESCTICRSSQSKNSKFCKFCLQLIDEYETTPIENGVALFPFTPEIREVIHLLKYGNYPKPASEIFGIKVAKYEIPKADLITSIPLHWRRYIKRGYNQSDILAKDLSKVSNIKFERVLKRTRNTKTQTKLDLDDRERNIKNAISPRKQRSLKGMSVIIVDDVFTTGATLGEANRALKEAGAESVFYITLASASH